MNWIDWVILAIAAFSVFAGLMDGLVKSVLSLASVIVAFFAASRFALPFGLLLEKWLSPRIAQPAGFAVVFLLVLALFALVTMLLRKTLDKLSLSWLDRLFGGVVGFVRAAAVLGLVAILVQGFGSFSVTRASVLFPHAVRSGEILLEAVPDSVKERIRWKRPARGGASEPRKGGGESGKDDGVI